MPHDWTPCTNCACPAAYHSPGRWPYCNNCRRDCRHEGEDCQGCLNERCCPERLGLQDEVKVSA